MEHTMKMEIKYKLRIKHKIINLQKLQLERYENGLNSSRCNELLKDDLVDSLYSEA